MTPHDLRTLGETWGPGWQAHLAAGLPCSTRTIRRWLAGKPIRPALEEKIRRVLKPRQRRTATRPLGQQASNT